MPRTSLGYRALVRAAHALFPVAAWADAKFERAHRAREGVFARALSWGALGRDPSRPLAWFHAPSVGEGLQAEAVMLALRAARPRWQLAYTHFSPSAEALARRIPAEFADYLPYDTPEGARAMLDALRPSALVFTKLDLWPELATMAAARGVKVVLVAGTVRPGSGRLTWPARSLLAPGYAALDAAVAIDPADAVRLSALGTRPEVITVAGDPRFDSVAAKVAAVGKDEPLLAFGAGAPTVVAGSTWEDDEEILLAAFARLKHSHPRARLILVPHEPGREHLARIDSIALKLALPRPVRLSETLAPTPLLVVDRVGVLAALYGAGTIAHVGGGYRRAGLHSVLEPAAWGLPVTMGPRWRESRDAILLREAGAAVGLPEHDGPSDPVSVLHRTWQEWLEDEPARERAGRQGRAAVVAGLGASEKCSEAVIRLVEG